MSKSDTKDLKKFLKPFPKDVQKTALWLHDFMWDSFPGCNELIYDNYNALAFGLSTSDRARDVFCHVAVYTKHVNFGFNKYYEIADPEHLFKGTGRQVRHITVDIKTFPKAYIKKMLKEAYKNSLAELEEGKQVLKGASITKSISPVKRRPK